MKEGTCREPTRSHLGWVETEIGVAIEPVTAILNNTLASSPRRRMSLPKPWRLVVRQGFLYKPVLALQGLFLCLQSVILSPHYYHTWY